MPDPFTKYFKSPEAPLQTGGNHPVVLDDPNLAWYVEEGMADLFLLPLENGEVTGPKSHVMRALTNSILFGLPKGGAAETCRLILIAKADSRIFRINLGALRLKADEPEFAAVFSPLLDRWIQSLYEGMILEFRPKSIEPLFPGKQKTVEANRSCNANEGVVWFGHSKGSSLLCSDLRFRMDESSGYFPLSERSWISMVEDSSITCWSTRALLKHGEFWNALETFHGLAADRLLSAHRDLEAQERERLRAKKAHQSKTLQIAVCRLASLLRQDSEKQSLEATDDELFSACRSIGRYLDIHVRPHPNKHQTAPRKDPLGDIAKASRFRIRKVILTDHWWTRDNGPLLVYQDEDNRPVSVIPQSPRVYHRIDPLTGERKVVDRPMAEGFKSVAYSFYRSFPNKDIDPVDILRFGFHGTRPDMLLIVLMGGIAGLIGILLPLFTGLIIDTLIPGAFRMQLIYLCCALVVAALASVVFEITRGIAQLRMESKSNASIESGIWDRILSLPIPFFRDYTAGDLAERAQGADEIRKAAYSVVVSTLISGSIAFCNFCLLFYYSFQLALLSALLVLLSTSVSVAFSFLNLRLMRPVIKCQGKIAGQVLQFITGITKLRIAGAEIHAYSEWAKNFSEQRRLDLKSGHLVNAVTVFNEVYPLFTTICLFALIGFWFPNSLTTGSFIAFTAAFSGFLYAMLSIGDNWLGLLETVPVYERIKPILETLPEVDDDKADPGDLSGAIEFSHVSFRYNQDSPRVLKEVSFQIKEGEFVAVVGPSGSGKSTLMRLLLGFEKPESGTIYFDGLDLAGLDVQAVRRQLGVVLQNGRLTPGSIYENIIGNSLLSLDDAWDAAIKAGLEEDIKEMPMGMHTVLGEGGGTLSGGQRQRLMIARAIVDRPRILIFDEATSALDNRTQALVSKSLEELKATRIVIAHRLSTIVHADRILVIRDGRLIESGTYKELLDLKGAFAELVKRQMD